MAPAAYPSLAAYEGARASKVSLMTTLLATSGVYRSAVSELRSMILPGAGSLLLQPHLELHSRAGYLAQDAFTAMTSSLYQRADVDTIDEHVGRGAPQARTTVRAGLALDERR